MLTSELDKVKAMSDPERESDIVAKLITCGKAVHHSESWIGYLLIKRTDLEGWI